MPTYVYRREDGSTFEVDQRISEEALTVCPTTGQKVTRVISGGTGLIFKGSGFYLTDYARTENGKSPGEAKPPDKTEAAKDKKTEKTEKTSPPAAPKDDAAKD